MRAQIAVDGPAASGKTTIGMQLADILDCMFLDTGLMYRAVTLAVLRAGLNANDEHGIVEVAGGLRFDLQPGHEGASLLVDGRLLGDELRRPAVDQLVSAVAAHPGVREIMVRRQRSLADRVPIVMAGRDIGTVVLPDAAVKLWVTASAGERARRRSSENLGHSAEIEATEQEIRLRDERDRSRKTSPLQRPPDALDLNTDGLTVEESVDTALRLIAAALEA